MEYIPLGDLEVNAPQRPGTINEVEIRDITSQILEGLKIMHLENFAHRDLKPKVIFVHDYKLDLLMRFRMSSSVKRPQTGGLSLQTSA